MAAKPKTWKDLRDQRRKAFFIGRSEHLRVFSDNFAGDDPNHLAFVVTGEGGVGKSTLLEQYANLARGQAINARVVPCDDQQRAPVEAMAHIARELAKHNVSLGAFDERLEKYRQLRHEFESDPQAPREAIDLLARGVSDLTLKTIRGTPRVGVFAEQLDPRAADESLSQMMHYGISKWGNRDKAQLLREPELELTPLFVDLLNAACETRRLVLMFDVFERTSDTLGPWLRALFNSEYGEPHIQLCVVISGRDSLDQYWTEFADMLCTLTLEPFTPDETRLYLANQHITDDRLVTQIHADTSGLPVLVELLASTKPQPDVPLPDISEDAVERFLQWTSQEQRRRIALLAAVSRQFNRDILAAALGAEAAADFTWLEAQSYIRSTTERGRFYHEKVRELMLRYLSQTEPTKLATTHRRLAEFFADQQRRLGLEGKAAYDSEEWCRLECERVYHTVSMQPEQQMIVGINAFFHAFCWMRRFAEKISGVCQQVAKECRQVNVREEADLLTEIYRSYDEYRYNDSIPAMNSISSRVGLTSSSRCEIYARIGYMFLKQGKFDKALDSLKSSLLIDEYDWVCGNIGEAYRLMGDYPNALFYFNRALDIDDKYEWAYVRRGDTYYLMGCYDEALRDFNLSISLNNHEWHYYRRGEVYRRMFRYVDAISDFSRAIELCKDISLAYGRRGRSYYAIGAFDKAMEDFNRAIDVDDEYIWVCKGRGETLLLMMNYADAINEFEKILAIDSKHARVYAVRGEAYRRMGIFDKALLDFNQSLDLAGPDTFDLHRRAALYRVLGDERGAKADLAQVMQLPLKEPSDYCNRGVALVMLGCHDEAIDFLRQAFEMDEYQRTYSLTDDLLDPIRDRADFQALLRGPEDGAASAQSPIANPHPLGDAPSGQS